MFYFHEVDGLRDALRLIPINCIRPSCSYSTEATASGTNITKDHKGCCTRTPALSHVWAVSTLADGMQFMGINKGSNMFVTFAYGKTNPQPIRFFLLLFRNGSCGIHITTHGIIKVRSYITCGYQKPIRWNLWGKMTYPDCQPSGQFLWHNSQSQSQLQSQKQLG